MQRLSEWDGSILQTPRFTHGVAFRNNFSGSLAAFCNTLVSRELRQIIFRILGHNRKVADCFQCFVWLESWNRKQSLVRRIRVLSDWNLLLL